MDLVELVKLQSRVFSIIVPAFPCHFQPSCLRFPELLPAKLKELRLKFEEIKDYFQSKDDDLSIQLLSSDLLEEIKHKFFTCEERSRSMEHVKEAYSRMKRNGIYKAMGEFDIFINYIERYLTMKRRS
ncbi:interleukin-10 [Geospiza fortis]|uniref:Interleukin family protein n=1 Tax=Geospiza fortis TaxID=48883 RepID=A0A6I9HSJ9_GEOFO|nr:interleukin-10 [Geospiza fortis]